MSPRVVVEEQQEVRRAQLIRATIAEVAEKGFSNVTLDDIAGRAGVSKGVALYYFESKEDLFLAAFERLLSAVYRRIEEAVAAAPDPVEKVRAVMRTTFVSARENRDFYRVFLDFLSLGTRNPEFQRKNARFYRQCCRMDEQIVKEGIRQGVFRKDADPPVFRAIFDGMMLQWLFDEPGKFGEYRDRCEAAVLAYLKR